MLLSLHPIMMRDDGSRPEIGDALMSTGELTRREFSRRALATAAIAGSVCEAAVAEERPAVEARRPVADGGKAGEFSTIEDLLVEVIRRRYPDPRLRPALLKEIRGDVAADVRAVAGSRQLFARQFRRAGRHFRGLPRGRDSVVSPIQEGRFPGPREADPRRSPFPIAVELSNTGNRAAQYSRRCRDDGMSIALRYFVTVRRASS